MAIMVSSCCGCISLKRGSIITGILGVASGIILLILVFATSVRFQTIIPIPDDIVKIIFAVNLVMTILISLLMVVGAMKRNKLLMVPWVVLGILLAIGMVISIIYTAVMCFINHDVPDSVTYGILWLVLGLPCTAVYVYLWVVVYSYYQLLREEDGRGKYGKPLRR